MVQSTPPDHSARRTHARAASIPIRGWCKGEKRGARRCNGRPVHCKPARISPKCSNFRVARCPASTLFLAQWSALSPKFEQLPLFSPSPCRLRHRLAATRQRRAGHGDQACIQELPRCMSTVCDRRPQHRQPGRCVARQEWQREAPPLRHRASGLRQRSRRTHPPLQPAASESSIPSPVNPPMSSSALPPLTPSLSPRLNREQRSVHLLITFAPSLHP
eukprot:3867579-Rhodomonas_salina.2